MGRTIVLEKKPKRIISLVPSQTELLHDLGLDEEVVGITKFCIYPDEWFHSKNRVGGTKNVDIEKVKALNPDLIIGNKEENTQEDILALEKIAPVWMSDIETIPQAIEMIEQLGEICGKTFQAELISAQIELKSYDFSKCDKTVLYLIWNEPMMAVGKHTFINAMLEFFGFDNYYQEENRYPNVDIESLQLNQPDFIFLSSEPFPFNEKHQEEIQVKFRGSKVVLVDGEMFSWYGSRMVLAMDYFQELREKLNIL